MRKISIKLLTISGIYFSMDFIVIRYPQTALTGDHLVKYFEEYW